MPGIFENDRVNGLDRLSPPIFVSQSGKMKPIKKDVIYVAYVCLKSLLILPQTGLIFLNASSRLLSSGILTGKGANLFSNFTSS